MQGWSKCLLSGCLTVLTACTHVGLQTHTGAHACVSWRAPRHTPADGLSPSLGEPVRWPARGVP